MSQSWSEWVGTLEWRREAEQWIHAAVGAATATVTAPIDQPRIRPWSTQLTVPTDLGRLWFKANCPAMSFEPRLQLALSALVPGDVDAPFAIDAERGWMLTIDRGATLGDSRDPGVDDWRDVVAHTARMQRRLATEGAALADAGLPDFSAARVPERFDRLIERFTDLPPTHPSHVDAGLATAFHGVRSRLVDTAQQVAASPIPSTLQHGDVHPWNVFAGDGQMSLFDFGDAQWAFAFESLAVPYGWIADQGVLAWGPVRDAYAESWSDLVTPREFETLWHASAMTHAVNRATTWWGALQGATDAEWLQWGEAPLAHLRNVLEAPR